MTNKRKIFLDFDGTIVNSSKRFIEIYNELTNDKADWTKINNWNFSDQCSFLTNKMIGEIFAMKEFFVNLDFYNKNTLEIFNELKQKYEILITTIGSPMNIAYKTKWIKDNLNHDNMILLSQNSTTMDKSIVSMANGIIIDDHEDNLFSSDADMKISFGVRKGWNKNWEGKVCLDWTELGELLL